VSRKEALERLQVSKKNLWRSTTSLELGDNEAAAFWAHQAAEFALKALSFARPKYPSKTHNLIELSAEAGLEADRKALAELNPYFAVSRYPNAFGGVPQVPPETAKQFYKAAEQIVTAAEREIHE
jgi:HEPN domain-containing protein